MKKRKGPVAGASKTQNDLTRPVYHQPSASPKGREAPFNPAISPQVVERFFRRSRA